MVEANLNYVARPCLKKQFYPEERFISAHVWKVLVMHSVLLPWFYYAALIWWEYMMWQSSLPHGNRNQRKRKGQ